MIDVLVIAAASLAGVLALLFAGWWVRQSADLCWMAALHPWRTLLAFVVMGVLVNLIAGLVLTSAGFVSTRFALALIFAPPFARYLADGLVWITTPKGERGPWQVGATFAIAQAKRRAEFLATPQTADAVPEGYDAADEAQRKAAAWLGRALEMLERALPHFR